MHGDSAMEWFYNGDDPSFVNEGYCYMKMKSFGFKLKKTELI
jgi:hypothetical protein